MRDDLRHLDLTFPTLPVNANATPHDLTRLLYKGGAALKRNQVVEAIRSGSLGAIQMNRIQLVRLIHQHINGELTGGGSKKTAQRQIEELLCFVRWVDEAGSDFSLANVIKTYLAWSEHLLHRVQVVKNIKARSAYGSAVLVGGIFDAVLGRAKAIIKLTRLKPFRGRKTPQGAKADKQLLGQTFAFGRLLQDICDSTPLEALWKKGPLRIPLQKGGEIKIWPGGQRTQEEERNPSNAARSIAAISSYEADRSLDHKFRRSTVNWRIQAELQMFIGQTGMNLGQAAALTLRQFSYASDIDGYKVRDYKERRGGEVLFEIFSEYRGHFERYLEWRRKLFPNEARLFPILRNEGSHEDSRIRFHALRNACALAGISFITPSALRGTRINWLLRRSGDADLTSEMAQHTPRTLLTVYERPSLQRAISEITQFHTQHDPALADKAVLHAVGPGLCDGVPKVLLAKPDTAPEPDCQRPSGASGVSITATSTRRTTYGQ